MKTCISPFFTSFHKRHTHPPNKVDVYGVSFTYSPLTDCGYSYGHIIIQSKIESYFRMSFVTYVVESNIGMSARHMDLYNAVCERKEASGWTNIFSLEKRLRCNIRDSLYNLRTSFRKVITKCASVHLMNSIQKLRFLLQTYLTSYKF